MLTGATFEVQLIDDRSASPVSGVTCTLYQYGVTITGGTTVVGTKAIPLVGTGSTISGTTDRYGEVVLSDIPPGKYAIVITGTGIFPQIPTQYSAIEISPLIRGIPDYLQMTNAGGSIRYLYISGDTVMVTDQLPSS